VAFAELGQAHARLEASLLDRACAEVYAGKPASLRVPSSGSGRFSAPAGHGASLYTKT